MVAKLFTKQTTTAVPTTSVTVTPPTVKSDALLDLTDPISKAKEIGIEGIGAMFNIWNMMQANRVVPTPQELIKHKDRWEILAELLKLYEGLEVASAKAGAASGTAALTNS